MENNNKKDWTILSFDLGVKNLAYCMMTWIDPGSATVTAGKSPYKVLYWDNINLIPETKKPSCQGIIKIKGKKAKALGITEKICGKVASFYEADTKETLCGTHLKDKNKAIEIEIQKVNKISNQELNIALVKALDNLPFLFDCDEVLLEHQPSTNPRTKNLSFMLYSYFIIRGFIDKPDSKCKSIQIRQINSAKKLSLYNGPEIPCDCKNTYDKNKFYSEAYCVYLLKDNNDSKWLEFFNSRKKKDDLADCFLQGAWFLNKHCNQGKKMTRIKKK